MFGVVLWRRRVCGTLRRRRVCDTPRSQTGYVAPHVHKQGMWHPTFTNSVWPLSVTSKGSTFQDGNTLLRKVGFQLPSEAQSRPRRPGFSTTPLWRRRNVQRTDLTLSSDLHSLVKAARCATHSVTLCCTYCTMHSDQLATLG
jgi:hypothetical protein